MEIHAHKNNNIGGLPNSPLASTQISYGSITSSLFLKGSIMLKFVSYIFNKTLNEALTVAASKEKRKVLVRGLCST